MCIRDSAEPSADLARRLHVPEEHAARIRNAVQRAAAPMPRCVWDEVERSARYGVVPGTPGADEPLDYPAAAGMAPAGAFVSSGSHALDACLGGGYARGIISEILGESSAGKTQLVLHTAVTTALGLGTSASVTAGGAGAGVALITTHGRSAARHMVHRMVHMAHAVLEAADAPDTPALVERGTRVMLRNVSIACAFTFDSAQHVLCYTLPGMIARQRDAGRDVALVVLDSVPPLLQDDSLEEPTARASAHSVRAARLHALAEWLKRLAAGGAAARDAGPLAVLVVNHVSDAFDHDKALVRHALAHGGGTPVHPRIDAAHLLPLPYAPQAAHFSGLLASVQRGDQDLKTAQLGLVWANCVNARFLVAHTPHAAMRRLAVVFAPTARAGDAALFAVTPRGIDAQ